MENLPEIFHLLQSIYIRRRKLIKSSIDENVISSDLVPVLSYINGKPGCSQKSIADAMGITASAVAQTAKKLEDAGLIKRSENEKSRREKCLETTAAGKATVSNTVREFDKIDRAMVCGISDTELSQLKKVLIKINAEFQTAEKVEISPWD